MQSNILRDFARRIIPLDKEAAVWAAEFRVTAKRLGRKVKICDAMIAGIARANNLTIATRNTADFQHLDIDVMNPWDYV